MYCLHMEGGERWQGTLSPYDQRQVPVVPMQGTFEGYCREDSTAPFEACTALYTGCLGLWNNLNTCTTCAPCMRHAGYTPIGLLFWATSAPAHRAVGRRPISMLQCMRLYWPNLCAVVQVLPSEDRPVMAKNPYSPEHRCWQSHCSHVHEAQVLLCMLEHRCCQPYCSPMLEALEV